MAVNDKVSEQHATLPAGKPRLETLAVPFDGQRST